MTFRPSPGMTIALIPALALLCWLGTWQVQRLHWKTALIAEMQAGWQAAPQDIHELLQPDKPLKPWQKVSIAGHFLPVPMKRWFGTLDGQVGYRYLQAFQIHNGPVIMVNRGFAPEHEKVTPAGQVPITLVGLTRNGGKPPLFGATNEREKNVWLWVDLPAMEPDALRVGAYYNDQFFVDLIAQNGNEGSEHVWPRPTGHLPVLPNNHLDYAMTWYGLALALLVIYFVWHWREKRLRF